MTVTPVTPSAEDDALGQGLRARLGGSRHKESGHLVEDLPGILPYARRVSSGVKGLRGTEV